MKQGKSWKWKRIHDLKAYHVYRQIKEGGDKRKLCKELSEDKDFKDYISKDSIDYKIENYRYLDTGQGLSGYSNQAENIFNEFKDKDKDILEKAIHDLEKKPD